MAYELATLSESTAPAPTNAQSITREEKIVSMYGEDKDRLLKAMSKITSGVAQQSKTDATNTNDSAVAEDPAKSGASLPLSPQLAALARKEQKFRQEQQKLKADALALDAERKELAELKALKDKIAAGDYSDADKLIDYEKFTQHKLGKDPKAEELEKVRAEIAAIKADREKDISDRFESAVNQRRVAVKTLIATNAEFPTIKGLNAEDAVVQHILDTWENDEIELSPEDAAKEVEAALLEKANKWAALAKKETPVPAEVQEKKELPQLKTGMKTLTNDMASTGEIKRVTKPLHMMTETERYAEARRRYEEKLKNGMR